MSEADKTFVSLKNVNKIYPNGVQAVFNFNLDINRNDFVVLVGPSGCGKSTTLRMIAGLEDISSGEFYINDELANFMPSKDRHIAMVFQSYALYPNMTVYENMAFGLKIQKLDPKEIEKRVFEAAKILDLGNYLDRRPKELSGGQMQRVALGRAIVRHAPIFLMDEPLSNLDAKLRVSMRAEIVRIHNTVGSTTIYVTHDQVEAMTMATKIVVMNSGFIQQIGTPDEIYSNPCNSFVAAFIGTPSMNLLKVNYSNGSLSFKDGLKFNGTAGFKKAYEKFVDAEIQNIKEVLSNDNDAIKTYYKELCSNKANLGIDNGDSVTIVEKKPSFIKRIFVHKKNETEKFIERDKMNELLDLFEAKKTDTHEILFGIRPEKIKLHKLQENETSKGKLLIKVDFCELLGSEYNVYFKLEGKTIIGKMSNEEKIKAGDQLVLDIQDKDIYLFDLLTGKRIY